MTSVALPSPRRALGQLRLAANTLFCLGLNLAIRRLRDSRHARWVMALLFLNEIRGLYVIYSAADYGLLQWIGS